MLSGFFTSLASVEREKVADVTYTATVYRSLYATRAAGLAVVPVIMLLMTPPVKRLMATRD